MRLISTLVGIISLVLVTAGISSTAEGFGVYYHQSYIYTYPGGHLYHYGYGGGYYSPFYHSHSYNPCFPFGCGGISEEKVNPFPRTEEQKPACAYDRNGNLFYARKGKNCPYRYEELVR